MVIILKEMCTIVHNDYEKVSDKIMFLSDEYLLKFNVELNRHVKNKKDNFYKEFGYSINGEYRVNISREFIYYLSIESVKRSDAGRLQVKINLTDFYFFKMKLQEVVSWFISEQYKNLFAKKDNRIIIPVKVNPIVVNVSFGQYIEFEPSTTTLNNGEQLIGVRVFLSSDNVSFFMRVNTLLALNDFISYFNMYQSAQLMLNYLGRPENGTNYMEFGNRQLPQHQSGFFNRVSAKNKDNQ